MKKENLNFIHIELGDITKYHVDVIVNAANMSLLGGGGVDGAIHKASGPLLLKECKTLSGCNPGEVKMTKAYNLPAKYIFHTPGPIYRGGNNDENIILKNSYLNSMKLLHELQLKSIAFPAISTGVYNFPKFEAAKISLDTILSFSFSSSFFPDVFFVLFDNENYDIYLKTFDKLSKNYI